MRRIIVILSIVTVCLVVLAGGYYFWAKNKDQHSDESGQNDTNPQATQEAETPELLEIEPRTYPIVDTGQTVCSNATSEIACPVSGAPFYGQDAQNDGNDFRYEDNGDGTVTDKVTGLMWQQDSGEKIFYYDALNAADSFELAGYTDWRVPTIKDLYSLINFTGTDPNIASNSISGLTPYIDDDAFVFRYGDTSTGDRIIDSQWVTSSIYVSTVFTGQECFFGVNFADGRIKCYPTNQGKGFYSIYVRGEPYGVNDFEDNNDGTISDTASGLMWQKDDNGTGVDWESALAYCESLNHAEYSDWRLPNAKELQSIVDYTRSPDTTDSPAIDPIFNTTQITNEKGEEDYPYFWTSTTHLKNSSQMDSAVYISFGRALGYMNGQFMDVHGAGAQRSDPKSGNPDDLPLGRGPQGDVQRIRNFVRCVRGD